LCLSSSANDFAIDPGDVVDATIGNFQPGQNRVERGQSNYEANTDRRLDVIERRQGSSERLREEQRMRRDYR